MERNRFVTKGYMLVLGGIEREKTNKLKTKNLLPIRLHDMERERSWGRNRRLIVRQTKDDGDGGDARNGKLWSGGVGGCEACDEGSGRNDDGERGSSCLKPWLHLIYLLGIPSNRRPIEADDSILWIYPICLLEKPLTWSPSKRKSHLNLSKTFLKSSLQRIPLYLDLL